jgi:hypothetical protein
MAAAQARLLRTVTMAASCRVSCNAPRQSGDLHVPTRLSSLSKTEKEIEGGHFRFSVIVAPLVPEK